MDSRESKYREKQPMSRLAKNEKLYQEINDSTLDNFEVRSNATVIGDQERNIDIEKIKKILDTKYNETPKRKSIRIEPQEEIKIADETTKEYDLKVVLEKAKDEKTESYEDARAKRLRNTQYDILNNLNLNETDESEEEPHKKGEEKLLDLINTITINEAKKNEVVDDPLHLLDDEEEKKEEQEEVIEENIKSNEICELEVKAEQTLKENKETIDNTFYTSNVFKKKDFVTDDSDDFVEDEKMSIGVKILIGLIVIGFIVGIFLFVKSFL